MKKERTSIHEQIAAVLARAEIYWLQLADDYQTRYSGSSDYDKSVKKTYYREAAGCRRIVDQVRNRTGSAADHPMLDSEVFLAVQSAPIPGALRQEIEQLTARLSREPGF